MLEATKLSQEEGEVDDQRRVQFSPDPSKLADGTCRFGFKGRKQRKEDGRRWRKCRGSLRRKEMRRKKQLQAHVIKWPERAVAVVLSRMLRHRMRRKKMQTEFGAVAAALVGGQATLACGQKRLLSLHFPAPRVAGRLQP
ncbi:hypothetical protein B296_00006130 [Ensete ventricosum]|uniref:Uncharacterized protein n=1 Tax=Ensete ventricosum TaxID=4639 RepID=A0A427ABU1_ENSVE|nr:hypothetical protein B296_00006130 [Ensete ventricosum]